MLRTNFYVRTLRQAIKNYVNENDCILKKVDTPSFENRDDAPVNRQLVALYFSVTYLLGY